MEYNKGEGLFCKKVKEWEGSLRNNEKGRVFWAKLPILLPSLSPQNRGGGRRAGDGPGPVAWELVGARGVGEKGEGPAGNRFPLLIWAEAVYRGGTKAAGGRRVGRRHCEARQQLGLGGNVEGGEGILLPPSPWTGMERGGGVTVACGGERRSSEWRCCVAWEVASGGGRRCGGGGRCEGVIYRPRERRWSGGGW